MNRKKTTLITAFFIVVSFIAYTQKHEVIMPFTNMVHIGNRPIPLQSKQVEFGFRVWFNIGTSIDRVITITQTMGSNRSETYCYLQEIGTVHGKKKIKPIYTREKIEPINGLDNFLQKVDSLNLFEFQSQEKFDVVADHSPFSAYFVEIKDKDRYHFFEFNTYWPYEEAEKEDQYYDIIHLIASEFEINFRFPN